MIRQTSGGMDFFWAMRLHYLYPAYNPFFSMSMSKLQLIPLLGKDQSP